MVILYDGHLGDTIIYIDVDLRGNIILERRELVLSYLHNEPHIGSAKHRIEAGKT